jgi:PAS domain S-box-containing protein
MAGSGDVSRRERAEAALQVSEEQFRLLVEGVRDYAILLLDPQGRIISWNAGAQHLFRYAPEEVLGRSFTLLFRPEDRQAGMPERELRQALADGRASDDNWLVRKDGGLFWVEGVTTAVRDADGRLHSLAKIVHDLTDRKRLEQQKDDFIGAASHEFRTPLTALKGNAQLLARHLRQPTLDRDALAGLAGRLQQQLGRLETLVADLLDVSRLQQGGLELRPEPVDLAELARRALARGEEAPERTARHTVALDAPAPVVGRYDPARLEQVLTNLLSNALKYSPAGGEVRVGVRRDGAWAVLAVSDQGLGIAPEEQVALFRPFGRGASVGQSIPGIGLGLYISAQIVAQHGGTIGLQSTPGAGSTFTVRLPVRPPEQASA